MTELYNEVLRLLGHTGFPETLCPIWTQDKFLYLLALFGEDMVNKTLKIDIKNNLNFAKIRENLKSLQPHLEIENNYVVKTPYSTNKHNLKFARDEEEVLRKDIVIISIVSLI